LNGLQFRTEQHANYHRLSQTQENTLIEWIVSRDKPGAASRPPQVDDMAHIILQSDNPSLYFPVGRNWASTLTTRREEIESGVSRKYNFERATCEDPKVLRAWFEVCFEELQYAGSEYRILDEDVFDFNEIGYTIGLIAIFSNYHIQGHTRTCCRTSVNNQF
jgi:hypothetical protein